VQVARARELVPGATVRQADATRLDLPPDSLDAVVCLYAVIHMPVAAQPGLISRIGRWLRPGGWLLLVTGHAAWTGTHDGWLGGQTTMWWAQADAADSRAWLAAAGLEVTDEEFVPEGDSGHALFWARRPTT
jgi:SAM-dependent methyltransferase